MKNIFTLLLKKSIKISRVCILLLTIASLILFISLRSGIARADQAMITLGQQLALLSESGIADNERGILLNDQRLHFKVFVVPQNIKTILDTYQSWCRGSNIDFMEQGNHLQEQALLPTIDQETDHAWSDLMRRYQDEDTAYLACIKHKEFNLGSQHLKERMTDFLQDGNLKNIGQFYYISLHSFEDSTRIVATWTEDDFYPLTIFPNQGDAAGFDPAGFSRPPSGRRILSAGELGNPETLTIYIDCTEEINVLVHYYQEDFARNHWQILSSKSSDDYTHLFVLQRGTEMRALSISKPPEQPSSVTIAATH